MLKLKLILAAVIVAGAVALTWHYVHTLEMNDRLRASLKAEKQTIQKIDQKAVIESNITKNEEVILKEVRDAPETDNAPVAPVLDLAVDRIDELRRAASD